MAVTTHSVLLAIALAIGISRGASKDEPSHEHHKYCIVGAGPAGVQVGHYLQEAGRDYIILDREPRAASWFARFPVHRVLNSINRRYTRRGNLEFNLRHDWNSLLGAEKTVGLFGTWSHEYWPSADTIVEYINAFAAPQVAAGHIRFGQNVTNIAACKSKGKNEKEPCRFMLTVQSVGTAATSFDTSAMSGSEAATCATSGKCRKDIEDRNATELIGKIAALEATVRNGNLDVSTLKELLGLKETLAGSFGSAKQVESGESEARTESAVSRSISCSVLVAAVGMQKPRKVTDWIQGLDKVAVEYETLGSVPRSAYENRSVLILGAGNAATETADHVRSVARDIQVVGRFASIRKMGESHYVGDVRVRRTTHEDAFYMKSYEGVHAVPFQGTIMVHCGPDEDNVGFLGRPPVCVFLLEKDLNDTILLASVDEAHKELVEEAVDAFGDGVLIRDPSPSMLKAANLADSMSLSFRAKLGRVLCITKKALLSDMTPRQRKLLVRLRDASAELVPSGEEFRKPYDVVITSLGWHFDQAPFDKTSIKLKMIGPVAKERKADKEVYPALNSEFELVSQKHLFVAGAAAHGIDRYRYKGSGGFIHGFRFNCRTLFRILEERYEAPAHPRSQPIVLESHNEGWYKFQWMFNKLKHLETDDELLMTGMREKLSPLWSKLAERINDAAGPYEMVGGSLVDAIIYDCKNKTAWYLEDLTEDMVHDRYSDHPRLTWSYHYGYFHRPNPAHLCGLRTASAGVFSAFIHPVLQYFPAGLKGGPKGQSFSQTHQAKYFEMLKWQAINKLEHPSAVWDKIEGVSRLHIMEAYIFGDWGDSKAIRQLEVFMSHIENAAGQFCSKKGPGIVERAFDEVIDVNSDHPQFRQDFQEKTKEACGGLLPQG